MPHARTTPELTTKHLPPAEKQDRIRLRKVHRARTLKARRELRQSLESQSSPTTEGAPPF